MRLDQFLTKQYPKYSRAFWQRMIGDHQVLVNGHPQKVHQPIQPGDDLQIFWPPEPPQEQTLPDSELDIIYEDKDLLVLNKPAGVVVHPAYGHLTGTLIEQVAARCGFVPSEFTDTIRPGLIHRLDKDTSGALLVAKNVVSQTFLARHLSERRFQKRYLTVLVGKLTPEKGLIDAPLARSVNDRRKVVVSGGPGSRTAQTKYEVRATAKLGNSFVSLVEVELLTGRTHQIRAHFAALHHPVLGDITYGNAEMNAIAKDELGLTRQALHAWRLGFPHPESGEMLHLIAPLPSDLQQVIDTLFPTVKL